MCPGSGALEAWKHWQTLSLGKLKRDSTRNPISEEDPGGIQYLKKFLAWLQKWEEINNIPHGLS